MLQSEPPMSTIFKFQLKLIIGGADQSMRKIGFMPFFGLAGLQNKFQYSLLHSYFLQSGKYVGKLWLFSEFTILNLICNQLSVMTIFYKSIFHDLTFLAFKEFPKTNYLSNIYLLVQKVPLQYFKSLKYFRTSFKPFWIIV